MIVITGANGQLGRLVIQSLLEKIPATQIVAAVRSPEKAQDIAALGVQVRQADYNRPDTLDAAFNGASKVLLISSSEVGSRVAQHQAVMAAAQRAGVGLLAYTSLLRADTSPLALASEHVATEQALKASGIPFVLLRNGWYTENYAASIQPALTHGVFIGSAGTGRIASASRADYAQAAATVMASEGQAGLVYELAGDEAYTLADFAAELSRQAGQRVSYQDLPQAAFADALAGAGLPPAFAALLADSDAGAAKGALFDDARQLSRLIGRPTTTYASVIAASLKG
ncbi:SDR family oxidoreductase [Pseudomethylobacillus aquaticus]|uniref:SDR family oxidoreductase n=1 Tax=Pseudomethylobacillus aquaticus TaxID=2676064 RepID=A0A3N0V6E8_9PROT|nr:SDR family oxidoreductase [Pseudomethylobacillus aquaticus]ROH88380.1 SDR family oxidoreductase [Pseudomethylobacillus aquaticus]